MKRIIIALAASLLLLFTGCTQAFQPQPTQAPTLPQTTQEVTLTGESPTEETVKEESVMDTQSQLLKDPKDTDLVRIRDYIPDAVEDLKYATADNFTGSVIYDFQDSYLRYGSVKKLMAVQEELRAMGLGIKIWDGFRPVSAQFKLWEICPDDTYVANPNVGYSNHSRGFAVDLTIVDENGRELEMPTAFDDFSGKADRNYSDVSETAKSNSLLLEGIMEKHGFKGYYGEWWHYNDADRYEVERIFDPGLISHWKVTGEEAAPMLVLPESASTAVARVEPGQQVTVMGYCENYALITWDGIRGYMECSRLFPA